MGYVPPHPNISPLQPRAVWPPPLYDLLCVRATGIFLRSSLLIKGHMEISPSPAPALNAEPCPARTPSTVGFVTVSEANLSTGLSVLLVFWLSVFILMQHLKRKAEVLIREEFSGLQWEETKKEG